MTDGGIIFRCFASGSSGNSYYLGTREHGVLIDAGISARDIARGLKDMGLDFSNIMAVLVTHDHADHIRAVGTLGERIHIPIYATPEIHSGIDRNYGVQEKLRTSRKYYQKGERFQIPTVPELTFMTFGISHDSTDCVGYVVDCQTPDMERPTRFMIATDAGSTSPEMAHYIATSQHIVIEANHDEHLLLSGPYPTYLKERILSPRGHQSNVTCGQMLAENWHDDIHHIFLCHLSEENNDPKVAYDTVCEYIESVGAEITNDPSEVAEGKTYFRTLERKTPSPVYTLLP